MATKTQAPPANRMEQPGTALTPQQQKANDFRKMLDNMKGQLASALPKHLAPERMIRVAVTAVQRVPELLECSQMSLIKCIVEASQLGLEPDGVLGHAYLLPFKNKHTGQREAQLIPGYKGLIDLCRRSGQLVTISADLVYRTDHFKFSKGLNPVLEHIPNTEGANEVTDIIATYAIAKLKGGGVQFEVMWRAQVEKIRARSMAKDRGPWVTDYGWMAKKTCLRQLCKLLPMSVEYRTFAERDEPSESISNVGFLDITPPALDAPKNGNGLDQLTDRLESEQGEGKLRPETLSDLTAICAEKAFDGKTRESHLQHAYGVSDMADLTQADADSFRSYLDTLTV